VEISILGAAGFCLAAYSVVGNDSIQTLGTFLSSNKNINWKWIWLFVTSILFAVIAYTWVINGGDIASGRLDKIPVPAGGIQWYHVIAPATLLIVTRLGIPVSTTFLVLSVFANVAVFEQMLIKSIFGYAVAATFAYVFWFAITKFFNEREKITNEKHRKYWVIAQWVATGSLWAQWLFHDLANIAVFLPRQLNIQGLIFVLVVFAACLAYTLRNGGGKIQEIVLSKSGARYTRSATVIDFIYTLILFVFKEWSDIPMSTTWVFVGLLCGRELAVHSLFNPGTTAIKAVWPIVAKDFIKILMGLAISVVIVLIVKNFL